MNSRLSSTPTARVRRCAGAAAVALMLTLSLSACGTSRVDGVAVSWPSFKTADPVVLPSDPAQCPALDGTYRAQGEFRSGDRDAAALKDLHAFFVYPLDLPGMRDASGPEWRSSPDATVTLARADEGWRVLARDGQGAQSTAMLAMLNGERDPGTLPGHIEPQRPDIIQRYSGCTEGRLWVSVRHDWRQHESMGVRRHVALFRPEAGGLLVTVQRESDSIGMLLPWYSNDSSVYQYWFAPAQR